jgi:hypothetical protein
LLIDATDLAADPVEMGDRYVWGLGNNGDLYPGAREVIESMTGTATLALITNGIGEVQRRRARLERDADHTRDRRSRHAHGDYLGLSRDRKREMMTEEVSQVHSIESATMTGRKHPVTTAFAWIFGAVAVLLSMFWVFLVVTIVSEWSSYVGHESSTATTIVAVFGIFTLGAWALAAAIFVAARRG